MSDRSEARSAARIRRRHRLGALLSPSYTCRHGKRLLPVAFNVYRGCGFNCGTTEPERWWHKLGWKLSAGRFDPFGRSAQGRRPW
jgi:hypothetical protein